MEDKELLEIFFSEAEELLQRIEKNLLALEETPHEPSFVQEVFRGIHTLKSSAAMVGFDSLSEYAHLLENLLERLRSGRLAPSAALISHLLNSQALLRTMVERAFQGKEPIEPPELESQKEKLNRFLGLEVKETSPEAALPGLKKDTPQKYYTISIFFKEDLFFSGQDPLMLLKELQELGEVLKVETDFSRVPGIADIDPFSLYLSWEILFRTRQSLPSLEDVFCFVRESHRITIKEVTDNFPEGVDPSLADKRIGDLLLKEGLIDSQGLQEALASQKKIGEVLVDQNKVSAQSLSRLLSDQEKSREWLRKSTIRVATQKLDLLANLVEETSVNFSRISHLANQTETLSSRLVLEEMEGVEKTLREIQEQVMRVRMFPLTGTFQRLHRLARDLAQEQEKEIRIEFEGEETELDKDLIEQITDPLKHLIRNAIDHGLEPVEERRVAGKTLQGTLGMKAFQREGRIYIQIRDDGRGLDEDAIYQKALESQLIFPGSRPSAAELHRFILLPGFSTAKVVSQISGRGVGMDVVREQIQRFGGTITIVSQSQQGTTITLSLPLTLSILEGLRIRIGQDAYLLPLSSIAAALKIRGGDLKTIEAKEALLPFEGEYLPVIFLENHLAGPRAAAGNMGEIDKIGLVLDSQRRRFIVLADQIMETRQVVIKGLESHFRAIPGISGGAILGDGSVCLILDIYGLDRLIFGD